MARSMWSGSISFGLVSVPVKAFTAVHDHDVHFHRIEKGSGARVRNRQVSEKTGEPVEPDDIELGFELQKGRYVSFDPDEIDALRPASSRTIDVADFVPLDEIDPVFFEHTYWLAPDGEAAEKAYGLLAAVMAEEQRVGIGSVVMRTKQYLAAVRPLDGALAMSTMRFADEVVDRSDIDALPKKVAKPSPKELKLASQIVDALASPWKPERYHDTYTEELRDLITRKSKGEEIVIEDSEDTDDATVLDLMAALQASVDGATKGRRGAKAAAPTKKATTRTTATKKTASKKTASKKTASKKTASKKTASKKTAAKKTATKRATSKKPTAKKAGTTKKTSGAASRRTRGASSSARKSA